MLLILFILWHHIKRTLIRLVEDGRPWKIISQPTTPLFDNSVSAILRLLIWQIILIHLVVPVTYNSRVGLRKDRLANAGGLPRDSKSFSESLTVFRLRETLAGNAF